MMGIAGQVSSVYGFFYFQFRRTLDNDEREKIGKQVSEKQKMYKYEDTVGNRADFWRHVAVFLGTVASWNFASTLSWKESFMVSLIVFVAAFLVFCSGKILKNFYEDINPQGQTVWSRLNQAKPLVKLIPLWITFIVYSLVEATGSTLFMVQSNKLNDRINIRVPIHSFNRVPVTSFYVLQTFTSFIASSLSDFLIKKFWSGDETAQHRARTVRVGIGMLFGIGCCMTAWRVEVHRLSLISKSENNNGTVPMTILWLALQFGLLGIAQGLVGKALRRFFCDRVPVSMWVLEFPFNVAMSGVGRFCSAAWLLLARPWIGDTIDKSHLDKYFLTLAGLNGVILVYYIVLTCKWDWNIEVPQVESNVPWEEVAGQKESVMASSL